jgi:hypothetical protein
MISLLFLGTIMMKIYKEGKCLKCGVKELMPPSQRTRCKKCLAAYQKEWKFRTPENREKTRNTINKYQRGLRRLILEHYSRNVPAKCIQCGESRYVCLELDHINNDGAEHGKKLCKPESYRGYMGWRGMNSYIYRDIKKNGYPEGFQTLCANCHRIKTFGHIYGKD